MSQRPDSAGVAEHEQAIIDSHVHLWDPRHLSYPWLADVPTLNVAHDPDVLLAALPEPVEAIFVEAGATAHAADAEIAWVCSAARTHPWIRGAVANVPLERPDLARPMIRRHAADPFVVGVRRNVQDEAPGFTAHVDFRAGVRALGEAGLPFDACVREHQLPELAELAAACPQTTIILDHVGKPRSALGDGVAAWRDALVQLAGHDNVVCKLSGLATELPADDRRAQMTDVLRMALDIFGPERCMYGSDWPVMTLATDYHAWLDLVRDMLSAYPSADAHAVLRANAARIYGLFDTPAQPGTPREEIA
jgi:L-fuconolactonase